ncbi:MAG: glucose-6-phosphate isomerase, partial [Oscillospiraceae bacterium]|nr:glucose-6-phosphate isomerase [Oscillospiraceae bacterium]
FRIFRDMLIKKYGPDCIKDRVFITTDRQKGTLKAFADEMGCETFVVPDDCGGRYSVLTAVGLLPIAVAGIDIDGMMQGAADAREAYSVCDLAANDCYKYAAYRNILHNKGKKTEILVDYEPCMTMMNEWWKQLYGESEGKDNKGLYPSSAVFSTDLHSLGQFIQDGSKVLFETVIQFDKPQKEYFLEDEPDNIDGLNFLSNQNMSVVNRKAFEGVVIAHTEGGVPNMILEVPELDEYNLGYIIYFFEKACAISGYLMGVNPFDQPGVESYKRNMFALLGKPGYEADRAVLEAKLGIN